MAECCWGQGAAWTLWELSWYFVAGAGSGDVEVTIQDPTGQKGTVEPQLEARGDSTYRCSYQPTMEGVHTVHVTFAGVPIPRSPYTVTIGQGRLVPATYVPHCWGLPWDGRLEGPTPALPTLAPGVSASTVGVSSLSSPAGALLPVPLALSISLSLHAFTFGRTCSSCLESCCSLLCPQGQRYLDLSCFGRGGLGGAGELVWSRWEEAITSWSGPQVLGSGSLSFLPGMSLPISWGQL